MPTVKPVRLDPVLMDDAARHAALEHRTTPKQIEYWAKLGRLVAKTLPPQGTLDLIQGFVQVRLEASEMLPVDVSNVLGKLEADRNSGILANKVASTSFRYGIDPNNLDCVVKVDLHGKHPINTNVG